MCGDLFGFGLTVDFHCLVRVRVVWFGISVFQLVLMCLDLRWWALLLSGYCCACVYCVRFDVGLFDFTYFWIGVRLDVVGMAFG